MELCKNDEVGKEASLNELKRQGVDLLKCRGIEMHVLVNKPMAGGNLRASADSAAKEGKGKGKSKAAKNL